ncbi:MAG: tRNA pseudouridine(38-40) synthase TruA [Lachnospiraceae bacterium]|nr:tRNA pseudouridine(38-40) synthase TruA [Lachnospiraceae bacterium]
MKRVMLTVAYDGTNYCGWQVQPNGETIEGVLNRCLSELMGGNVEVIGASRTDSGVHAMGNVAVFDTDSPIPADKISYALNRSLPEDIRVRKSEEVSPEFHPRHCDSRKTYEYRIYCAPFPMPTKRLYSYFTYVPLNVDYMSQSAECLIGLHDFKSFCSAQAQVETTVRRIDSIEVWEECERNWNRDQETQDERADRCCDGEEKNKSREIVIRVTGGGFLYNMVRIIAGTLMEVGRGHIQPQDMEKILNARDRQAAGPTAPACGLTLVGIEYAAE